MIQRANIFCGFFFNSNKKPVDEDKATYTDLDVKPSSSSTYTGLRLNPIPEDRSTSGLYHEITDFSKIEDSTPNINDHYYANDFKAKPVAKEVIQVEMDSGSYANVDDGTLKAAYRSSNEYQNIV